MSSMYAKVIADSIANDIRITTMELYYPLMIHAQAKTHRMLSLDDECYIETNYSVGLMDDPMLSRNAQSNRAMPVAKMLEQVRNNPAMPSHWGKNQPGMSASEDEVKSVKFYSAYEVTWMLETPNEFWRQKALEAADAAVDASESGLHKQVANRLTMPFQYIKVIVTATEWDNFFKLRLNDADPTMMELARKMKEAMDDSFPRVTAHGDWHLPYTSNEEMSIYNNSQLRRISAARCARVSYNNHDNSKPIIEKDIALAERLLKDGHMSPFEHQAAPMKVDVINWNDSNQDWEQGVTHSDRSDQLWSGNFRGWIQYRALVDVK